MYNTWSECLSWYVCLPCPYAEWYLKYAHWVCKCVCVRVHTTSFFRLLALPMYGWVLGPRYLLVSSLSACLSCSVGAENRNYLVGIHSFFFLSLFEICPSHAAKYRARKKSNAVGCEQWCGMLLTISKAFFFHFYNELSAWENCWHQFDSEFYLERQPAYEWVCSYCVSIHKYVAVSYVCTWPCIFSPTT